jgi:hypothetical protein
MCRGGSFSSIELEAAEDFADIVVFAVGRPVWRRCSAELSPDPDRATDAHFHKAESDDEAPITNLPQSEKRLKSIQLDIVDCTMDFDATMADLKKRRSSRGKASITEVARTVVECRYVHSVVEVSREQS